METGVYESVLTLFRFSMKLELIKPDKIDTTTSLKGVDYIEVPGMSSKDYKLQFYAYKENQYQFKVFI